MKLEFEEGRAEVELANGTMLSILNPARDELLRERRQWSPSYLLGAPFPMARADEETYEVALCRSDTGKCAGIIDAPGWEQYLTDDHEWDSWTTYGYVPLELILVYIGRVGLKE